MKLRFGNGDILLPVAKAELGFDISRLTKHYANELGLRVRLQENFTQRIRRVNGIAGAFPRRATQNSVAILQGVIFRFSAGGRNGSDNFDAST